MHINLTPTMAFAVLLVAACSTGAPISLVSLTPKPAGAALDCAVQTVKNMGYTIKNEAAGWFTAEKKTSGTSTEIFSAIINALPGGPTGNGAVKTWSKLTVSVSDMPAGKTEMAVTAWQASSSGHGTNSSKPTAHGVSDAKGLLSACGKGETTE